MSITRTPRELGGNLGISKLGTVFRFPSVPPAVGLNVKRRIPTNRVTAINVHNTLFACPIHESEFSKGIFRSLIARVLLYFTVKLTNSTFTQTTVVNCLRITINKSTTAATDYRNVKCRRH